MPGQSVTYIVYAGNTGAYDAYLNKVTFNNVSGEDSFKICTAGTDTSADLVASACEAISVTVDVDGDTASETSTLYNHILYKGNYEPITITLTYASDGARADGDFSVSFGDISFDYSTVDSSVTLISFTMDGEIFQAEEGMTWEEWIGSSYNQSSYFYISNGFVMYDVERLTDYNGIAVSPSDIIEDSGMYMHEECCFDPNMRVLMADGTYKAIVDVQVGDMVMSLNEDTGEYVAQKVNATIINKHSTDLVYVNLSNGVQIGMRAYHPLLTEEGWKSLRPEYAETQIDVGKVSLLEVGDTLVGYDENVTIVSVEQRPEVENYYTYNLSVEGYHNYIVEGVVVHNARCITDPF